MVALWSWLVRQYTDFTMWLFRATCAMCSYRRKGEGAVFLSSVKDNQSVDEKSLGSMRGFVRTEARSLGKLRRDITT